MQKRSLHYIEAPGKNISPRRLNFSQIHHQTHSWTEKKTAGSGLYRKAAIMSERPLKLSGADFIIRFSVPTRVQNKIWPFEIIFI
jgi:hypothetical protein